MEQVVSKNAPYSRYGSDILKQAYIYGALDMSPTILTRSFGFGWNIGGWLLFSFLQKASTETAERSEEHTSELQSLMRISYAVLCLNKKTCYLPLTTLTHCVKLVVNTHYKTIRFIL